MDFSLSEAEQAVVDLARTIFEQRCTEERLRALEAEAAGFDGELWSDLATSGLLGAAIGERWGGGGLGFLAAALVAKEAGRAAALVPVGWAAVGALFIERWASEPLQRDVLPKVVAGDAMVSVALSCPAGPPGTPTVNARTGDGRLSLSGTAWMVPAGMQATAVILPVATEDGLVVVCARLDVDRVVRKPQSTTSGRGEAAVAFEGTVVPAEAVVANGERAEAVLRWLLEHCWSALAMEIAGACEAALALIASYTATREQFGKPIATFQAVGQRAADAYVDTQAVWLTALEASWRLGGGLPAAREAAVAKFFADEAAQRVVHAAVHLHGGVGVDRDYPLHRYFLAVKHLSGYLGGATTALLRLAEVLDERQPVGCS
jgi:alkylation response protein AidB-like acyl-CoA dehydrogenase